MTVLEDSALIGHFNPDSRCSSAPSTITPGEKHSVQIACKAKPKKRDLHRLKHEVSFPAQSLAIGQTQLKSQVLKDYLLHVVPAVLIPAGLYLSGETTSPVDLFKIMLLFPLMLLAMRGLGMFFPPENIRQRTLGRTVEYASLQALVFSAFMVMFTDYMQPDMRSSLVVVLRQFVITAALMSVCNLGLALHTQRKLGSS